MDFFICHATEDKETFVREFFEHLAKHGALTFYDEYSIKLGDSITATINRGLAACKNAIIVLSKSFFDKKWTQSEMQAIFSRAQSDDLRIIIILHGISHDEVRARYPLLADLKAIDSSVGIPELSQKIFEATEFTPRIGYFSYALDDPASSNKEGFSVMLNVQLLEAGDAWRNKYIFEAGLPSAGASHVSLRTVNEELLVFSVTDASGRSVEISTACQLLRERRCILIAVLSRARASLELYINGNPVAGLTGLPKEFIEAVKIEGGAIVFNSLDLRSPCGARLSGHSIGNEMTPEDIFNYTKSLEKLHRGLLGDNLIKSSTRSDMQPLPAVLFR